MKQGKGKGWERHNLRVPCLCARYGGLYGLMVSLLVCISFLCSINVKNTWVGAGGNIEEHKGQQLHSSIYFGYMCQAFETLIYLFSAFSAQLLLLLCLCLPLYLWHFRFMGVRVYQFLNFTPISLHSFPCVCSFPHCFYFT